MICSVDVRTGEVVAGVAEETPATGVRDLCAMARAQLPELEGMGRHNRASLLSAMADALERQGDQIVATADRETALGEVRLRGELARTCGQLRFFGEVITDGAYLEVVVDHQRPGPGGPQPDLRRLLRPIGPVAVFGASNFPLAFSVPGGDTASALAAGCPVVVKVHEAHPATSVLCAAALAEGARGAGMASTPVHLVFGQAAGAVLVTDRDIAAVGFTGSPQGGRALSELARSRPSPIPFYGELGALNAVVIGPAAATNRPDQIARGLASSFNLGTGQFCTKPGLALVPEGQAGDALCEILESAVRDQPAGLMLSKHILTSYTSRTSDLRGSPGVRVLAEGMGPDGRGAATALLLEAQAAHLAGPLLEECFGPVLVLVRYSGAEELIGLLAKLAPALTATVQADPADEPLLGPVLNQLGQKVGRVVWNGYPTGVAVTWAMHHGGPYPATTDVLHTSVGAAAIRRWLRPVTYQDVPDRLLPPELRETPEPTSLVPRRVDGRMVL